MSIGNVPGPPKGVVGNIARDTTPRPSILKLKAPTFSGGKTASNVIVKK